MTDLAIALLVLGVTWLVVSDWLRGVKSAAEEQRARVMAEAFLDSGDYDDAIRLGNSGAVTFLHGDDPIYQQMCFERWESEL